MADIQESAREAEIRQALDNTGEIRYYAGIGSRETPPYVQKLMTEIAAVLEQRNFVLRSGGANGADKAFENGVVNKQEAEIYVPWPGFNGIKNGKVMPAAIAKEAEAIINLHSPVDREITMAIVQNRPVDRALVTKLSPNEQSNASPAPSSPAKDTAPQRPSLAELMSQRQQKGR